LKASIHKPFFNSSKFEEGAKKEKQQIKKKEGCTLKK